MYERPSKRTGLWVVLAAAIPPLGAFVGEVYSLIPSLDSLQILAFMICGGAWESQAPHLTDRALFTQMIRGFYFAHTQRVLICV